MDDLEEIPAEEIQRQIEYVFQQRGKLAKNMQDDLARKVLAQKIMAQLSMSGVRFFKKPSDMASRWPDSTRTR